jgi:hydroxypyruvate isomerase
MPRFSANLVFLFPEVPFLERFEHARAAGFEAVEYMFPYDYELEDIRRALKETGLRQDLFNLPAGDFQAGDRGVAVDPARREEFAAGVERALATADALECRKINCLVGLRKEELDWDTQYGCLVENLAHAAERLGAAGLTLHIELLNTIETPGFFLDSIELVNRVLDDVASPHLKFQCDLYHLQRTSGNLVPTMRSLGARIGHYQIADAPDRHEPGTGEINYRYVLAEIDASGYDGFVGLEYKPSGKTKDPFAWIREYGYRLGGTPG